MNHKHLPHVERELAWEGSDAAYEDLGGFYCCLYPASSLSFLLVDSLIINTTQSILGVV